tara:strand:+ start:5633 stop:5920 length:288 start_codon:yes stop_codon:yes gene_type:complete
VLRGQREREREREREEHHGVRELQSDSSDIDDVGRRIIVEEKRRRTKCATKCEWNSFVRFQFDTTNTFEDDDEGKTTVALETTSVTAWRTRWVRS